MTGCFIFAGVLFAALALKAHHFRRRWHRGGCGSGGCGAAGCGGDAGGCAACGHRGRRRGWRGFRGPLYHVLARLDLSPAQEKVVRAEVDRLRERARGLRDEGAASRADLARAIRGDGFDETALADMFVRHDDRLRELREELGGALGRIHLALDERQRERLAALFEGGFGRGPYR